MTTTDENDSTADPFIEVILSRSSYRVGESVVGTIRLVPSDPTLNPRDVFLDSQVFVAGWCRLDPRWHRRAFEYVKKHESPAIHDNLHNKRSNSGNVVIDEHCVCFWTTNVLQLQYLQERTNGRWEDVKPKPIRGMEEDGEGDATAENKRNGKQSTATGPSTATAPAGSATVPLEDQQLAFTFRVELPLDLPHTLRANSCRYFYAVVVATRVKIPSIRKPQWLRHATPIQVLSPRPDQPPTMADDENAKPGPLPKVYPMGVCTAMAHSAGLPCHVTATQLYQPPGQILVNRRGTPSLGCLVTSSSPLQAAAAQRNLQTMRITDLQGIPCCVLTVMGVSTASPGSRMVLKFDFPLSPFRAKWTPCYQICASLEGEEVAMYTHYNGTRKRARAYQFDTAHELVDPDCTERVCLSLQVPLDAPISVRTDLVQITVKCIIDITVGKQNANTGSLEYSNLRLELPVRMVHPWTEYEVVLSGEEEEQDEDDAYLKLPLDELLLGRSYRTGAVDPDSPPLIETEALRKTNNPTHPSSFATKDIRQDLTILSLRMADECQLVERE